MKRIRRWLELGCSATVIGALLLTACGGGGSGVGATATGTSVTLTPVKGKFQGSCMVSVTNTAGVTLFSGLRPIAANGTTTVTLAAGSTGPYVISVSGDAGNGCQYFNDNALAPQLMTMLPSESLNALVISAEMGNASGVAVTPLTEMAYQAASAVNNGTVMGLRDDSPAIHQGIAAAVNLVGLTGASAVTSIFAPPAVLPQSGVAVVDGVGRVLVQVANLNATRPLDGVRFAALQAAEAARPASAVQFQTARNAIPVQPNGQGAAMAGYIASAVQGAASAVMNAGNASQFLNDITSASGVRDINFGFVTPGGNNPTVGTVINATLSNLVYTVTRSMRRLLNRVWSGSPSNGGMFVLGANGWIDSNTASLQFSINPDGSAKMTQDGYGTVDLVWGRRNLSGVPFVSAVIPNMDPALAGAPGSLDSNAQLVLNASGVPTLANVMPVGTFSTGAAMYNVMPVASSVTAQPIYLVQMGGPMPMVTAPGGAQLTALPIATSSFCLQGNTLYVKPSATAGAFDVFSTAGTCVAPALGAIPLFTVVPSVVTVNGATFIEVVVPNGLASSTTQVIALVNGLVYWGQKLPVGSLFPWTPGGKRFLNVAAMQQLMQVLGVPAY